MLIFVQSKERAKELYAELLADNIRVDVIHSDLSQAHVSSHTHLTYPWKLLWSSESSDLYLVLSFIYLLLRARVIALTVSYLVWFE